MVIDPVTLVAFSLAAFVAATAAIIAVFIDATRLPVYLLAQQGEIAAAYAGTYLGQQLVGRVSQTAFRRIVNAMIAIFGLVMIAQGGWGATGQAASTIARALLAALLLAAVTWVQGALAARAKAPR